MIKPYYNNILESDNLIKCAKKYYNIIKNEKLEANGLFILKDTENNKLFRFQITKNNLIGGDNQINKEQEIIKRIESLENKINNLEKIIISNK